MHMRFLICCGLLLFAFTPANGQVIIGRVIDESSKLGLRAVELQLVDRSGAPRGRILSDSTGLFRLQAPIPGPFRVKAAIIGYATVTSEEIFLAEGIELDLELKMAVTGIPLDPIRVIGQRQIPLGRLADYYQRSAWTRKTGNGRVFMRDDLDRMDPFNVSSILRMQPRRPDCPMWIMLDGLQISEDMVDQMIQPEDVEGIEIYRSQAEVPPEYMRRTPCALTLIWTRRDLKGARPMTWRRILITVGFIGLIYGAQAWVR